MDCEYCESDDVEKIASYFEGAKFECADCGETFWYGV